MSTEVKGALDDFAEAKGRYVQAAESQLEHVGGVEELQAMYPISPSTQKHLRNPNPIPENAIFGIMPEEEARAIAGRLNEAKPEGVPEVTFEHVIGRYMRNMLDHAGLTFYGAAEFKKKTLSVFENSGNLYTLEPDSGYMCVRRITTKNVKLIKADKPEPDNANKE